MATFVPTLVVGVIGADADIADAAPVVDIQPQFPIFVNACIACHGSFDVAKRQP